MLMRTGGAGLLIPGAEIIQAGGGECTPFSQIDGSVSVGATFTHPADGVIAWTQTTVGGGFDEIRFRIQDTSNFWSVFIGGGSPGAIYLSETVAGVKTDRAFLLSVVGAGHRVVIVANGTTINVYSNSILRVTYASASNFATRTDGKVQALSGTISNLKTWQLACRAMEGV